MGARLDGAGTAFAVVAVTPQTFDDPQRAGHAQHLLSQAFGGIPIVLISCGDDGNQRLLGRPDLALHVRHLPPGALPWQTWRATPA